MPLSLHNLLLKVLVPVGFLYKQCRIIGETDIIFFYTSFSDINKQDIKLTSGDNVKKYDLFENNLSLEDN